MPLYGNNIDIYVARFTAEGVPGTGVAFSSNLTAVRLSCIYCTTGAYINDPGGVPLLGGWIGFYACEGSHVALQAEASEGTTYPLVIGLLNTESVDTWIVQDLNAILTGAIHWSE